MVAFFTSLRHKHIKLILLCQWHKSKRAQYFPREVLCALGVPPHPTLEPYKPSPRSEGDPLPAQNMYSSLGVAQTNPKSVQL